MILSGPTREYIDPVRYMSNESSGKMGAELAKQALKKKSRVIFISGPAAVKPPQKAEVISVTSALEMFEAAKKNLKKADIVIIAAAVADFRAAAPKKNKIKKGAKAKALVIRLKQNPDIAAYCGKNKNGRVVAGFALETDNLIENAFKKLKNKNLDLIAANGKESLGADKAAVHIIKKAGSVKTLKAGKNKIAGKIINETIGIFKSSKAC